MKKGIKYVLIGVVALVIIGIIGSELDDSKNQVNATPTPEVTLNQDSLQKAQTFDADNILAYYEENEVKADETLKGSEFWVKGRVKTIAKDIMNQPYVTLGTDMISSVQCVFEDPSAVANLKKGDLVTIKGECNGKTLMNVLMKDCSIAKNLK